MGDMYAFKQSTSNVVVKNPPLPFIHQTPNGLRVGQTLIVRGKVNFDAHRLEFNFNCGNGRYCDVACHFNPRFDSNKIVLNDFTNGKWGTEEFSTMYFSKNQYFTLKIEIMSSSFKFSVDERFCYNYRCKFPLSRITAFNVELGVHINEFCILDASTSHEQRPYMPSPTAPRPHHPYVPPPQPGMSQPYVKPRGPGGYPPAPGSNPPAPGSYPPAPRSNPPAPGSYPSVPRSNPPAPGSYPPAPGSNLPAPGAHPMPPRYNPSTMKSYNVPYVHSIHGGLTVGRMIYISGYPKPSARRFCINFVSRKHGSNDIALHFNPRFSPDNCVVRNSESYGNWGREERVATYFPFSPGVNFDMIIKVESRRFMIAVNGVHFTEFIHRLLPIESITSLEIKEDVVLTNVSIA